MCKGLQGPGDFYWAMETSGCVSALQILPIRSIKPAVIRSDRSCLPGNELVSFILIAKRQVFTPPKSTAKGALKEILAGSLKRKQEQKVKHWISLAFTN